MTFTRRVFVSSPRDEWLNEPRKLVKHVIIDQIRRLGYEPQFFDFPGSGDLTKGKRWSFADVDQVIRNCVGAAIIGLRRWAFIQDGRDISLPSEYCHYEGSLAYTHDLPTLAFAETGIEGRGTFVPYGGHQIVPIPRDMDRSWLDSPELADAFKNWKGKLENRRDVFLGYCSTSSGTARNLRAYLEKDLGARVLDWQTDFRPGRTILSEIKQSATHCSSGIFLFTQDDKLDGDAAADHAAPRDNVIFEAGYFISAKGKEKVLIVVQSGTKIPADLGGDIYAQLENKSDVGPIKDTVLRFVQAL